MSWESGLISGAITSTIGLIAAYFVLKEHKIEDILVNSMEQLIKDVSQDAELQKTIYSIGALLGNGAKIGIGLNTRGGKFKLGDVINSAIGHFVESMLGKQQEQSSNTSSNLP